MLLGILGASLLGNLLTGKESIRTGAGTIRVGHPLTNFEMQKYYQKEPKSNGVYSRNNLPKDGAYVIKFDELKTIETYWKALYMSGNNIKHFDCLELNIFQKKLNDS